MHTERRAPCATRDTGNRLSRSPRQRLCVRVRSRTHARYIRSGGITHAFTRSRLPLRARESACALTRSLPPRRGTTRNDANPSTTYPTEARASAPLRRREPHQLSNAPSFLPPLRPSRYLPRPRAYRCAVVSPLSGVSHLR